VTGAETFAIPYGPIRSGVFEAAQFVIETGGEDVLALDVRPLFKHRRLESRFAGLTLDHASYLAERVAGIASVAHGIAFAEAVERAAGVEPPRRAALWRTVLGELERIANHLDVAARLAEDPALAVGAARFAILKEDVLRLQAELAGSRFARGLVCPGGIRREPSLPPSSLAGRLLGLERALERDRRLLLGTTSFTDRLIGSGRLDRATVERLAAVGPVARGSGLSTDARFERPYAAYARLGFEVVTREEGDAMARLEVRFGEVAQSLHLIRQALDGLARANGEVRVACNGCGAALGWSEAPQGEVVYWVAIEDGRVVEAHVASPSFRNWALFAESFRGDVLTDFAFIEHSFGLTPAGASR
jgi:Ni,Fe-hydrogenase III large subunit